MHPALVVSLAVAGLLAGWPQRALIARLAVPADPFGLPGPDRPGPHGPHGPHGPYGPPAWLGRRLLAPAAGAVTAVLLGLLAARVHPALVLAAACWLAVCAVPLAVIDAAVYRLPDPLTAAAYAGTAALLLAAAAVTGPWPDLLRAGLGGLALAGFYLLLAVISPSGMSLGDVKLAASLGTLLAWFGWPLLIGGGFAGFLLGGIFASALLVHRKAGRKQLIPFGPFMVAGAVLALVAWPR